MHAMCRGNAVSDGLDWRRGWCMFPFILTWPGKVDASRGGKTMERRWTTRRKLGLEVDVVFEGGHLSGCQTRDIGLGGVFVKTGDRVLPDDQPVEVRFKLQGPVEVEEHKIRAKVVRLVSGGAGLMFRDFDAGAFRSLQRVLKVRETGEVEMA